MDLSAMEQSDEQIRMDVKLALLYNLLGKYGVLVCVSGSGAWECFQARKPCCHEKLRRYA